MSRRDTLDVVDPLELPRDSEGVRKRVHGVVLAAGTSSRFGERNKLLEPVNGELVISHVVSTLLASNLDDVTVVVGYEANKVRGALDDFDVTVRLNEAFDEGQSTSVASGVAAARNRDADAVLLALGDMPTISVETVDLLVSAYQQTIGTAIAAAYDGKRGNPVLFDNRHFDDLENVSGDVGGREILLTDDTAVAIETRDPGVLSDIDRPDDI